MKIYKGGRYRAPRRPAEAGEVNRSSARINS